MNQILMWGLGVTIGLLICQPSLAYFEGICNLGSKYCGRSRSSSPSANPSSSSRLNINPSAVPTEEGFGFETILYQTDADYGIVRGLGRVGAAISPSNGEETFFGAPSYETYYSYFDRKLENRKYEGQKYTLATAFNLYESNKSGLRKFNVNVGVLARYNSLTNAVTPGGGISGVAGPFTFGYSLVKDETLMKPTEFDPQEERKIQSMIETYSLGMYLNMVVLDYSSLRIRNEEVATVDIITFAVLASRLIATISQRVETSERPSFNVHTQLLQVEPKKTEYFYGLQFRATPWLMFGGAYNYYLLRELSINATLLF